MVKTTPWHAEHSKHQQSGDLFCEMSSIVVMLTVIINPTDGPSQTSLKKSSPLGFTDLELMTFAIDQSPWPFNLKLCLWKAWGGGFRVCPSWIYISEISTAHVALQKSQQFPWRFDRISNTYKHPMNFTIYYCCYYTVMALSLSFIVADDNDDKVLKLK